MKRHDERCGAGSVPAGGRTAESSPAKEFTPSLAPPAGSPTPSPGSDTPDPSHVIQEVVRFLNETPGDLLRPGPVVAAVSGGPDSVCLLHALDRLSGPFGIKLHVAHLHHGQRPEADADAAFVAGLAGRLGWPCTLERADVPAIARAERLSLEAAGRAARYRFLARLAAGIGAASVMTGHNADDQAETVLMRALRGAGIRGLRGIPARGPLPDSGGALTVLRPLLAVSREEICRCLAAHGLEYRIDATNADMSLQRNRVRAELLPLAESISPGARRGLVRLARAAAEDEAALEALTAEAWERCAAVEDGAIRLDRGCWPDAAALRRRILRRAAEALSPDAAAMPETAVQRLLDLLAVTGRPHRPTLPDDTSGMIDLPMGLRARFAANQIWIGRRAARDGTPPILIEAAVPGETSLAPLPYQLIVEPFEAAPPFPSREAWEAVVDAGALALPLYVRTWLPGDRIRIPGVGGTRKLQDLFTDAHVPALDRGRWPLVCDAGVGFADAHPAGRIVWVPGLALHEAVRITPETCEIVRLQIAPSVTDPAADDRSIP